MIPRSAPAIRRFPSASARSRLGTRHCSGRGVLNACLIVIACIAVTNRPAHAGHIGTLPETGLSLSELIGHAFLVDDKEFFITSFDSTTIDPTTILVLPVNLGLSAIGFDLVGAFGISDDDNGGLGGTIGFTLAYTVDVLTPGFLIEDANLAFDGFAEGGDDDGTPGDDDAMATITEVIKTLGGGQLATLGTFAMSGMDDQDWVMIDKAFFAPQTSISVLKTVLLFADEDDMPPYPPFDDNGASMTFIRQTFSQIPAPGALALLGVAGLAGGRRRRRDRTA